jgi:hypothetical protein
MGAASLIAAARASVAIMRLAWGTPRTAICPSVARCAVRSVRSYPLHAVCLFVAILAVTLPLPLDEGELDPSGSGIELDEGESGDDEGPGEANSGTDSDRSEFKPGGSDGESEVSDEESEEVSDEEYLAPNSNRRRSHRHRDRHR